LRQMRLRMRVSSIGVSAGAGGRRMEANEHTH
jgi:hypothetical protein